MDSSNHANNSSASGAAYGASAGSSAPQRIYLRHIRKKSGGRNDGGRPRRERRHVQAEIVEKADTRCLPMADASPSVMRIKLLFTKESGCVPWGRLERYLINLDNVLELRTGKESAENPVYEFFNSATRTEARFAGYLPQNSSEAGLCFELGLPCPSFFARESMTMLLAMAREFRLSAAFHPYEPRSESADSQGYSLEPLFKGSDVSIETFMAAWAIYNRWARILLEKSSGLAMPRYRRSILENVWEYRIMSRFFRSKYARAGRCTYPDIWFVRSSENGQVFTVCDWNAFDPVVFPMVELIRLADPPAPIGNGKFISAARLFSEGKRWVKKIPIPMRHYLVKEPVSDPEFMDFLAGEHSVISGSCTPVSYRDIQDF